MSKWNRKQTIDLGHGLGKVEKRMFYRQVIQEAYSINPFRQLP